MPHNQPIGKLVKKGLEHLADKVRQDFKKVTKIRNDDDFPPPSASTGDHWLRPEAA